MTMSASGVFLLCCIVWSVLCCIRGFAEISVPFHKHVLSNDSTPFFPIVKPLYKEPFWSFRFCRCLVYVWQCHYIDLSKIRFASSFCLVYPEENSTSDFILCTLQYYKISIVMLSKLIESLYQKCYNMCSVKTPLLLYFYLII